MSQERSRYIIGIDLGTTNSAVSYVDMDLSKNPAQSIQQFRIPQLTGNGIVEAASVLPSFFYMAAENEFPYGSLCLPWDPPQLYGKESDKDFAAGIWARDQGARVPTRLVQSAKSWLCNASANRREKILPFEAADEERRVSPVEASAAYLRHIKDAWNSTIAKGEISKEFEQQEIILTVPASFDEVARSLTVEAARLAGYPQLTLLEEPQAAFYSWMIDHEKLSTSLLKDNEVILVCDVGGGTTDFSLILAQEKDDSIAFQRMAVGNHLLLGGDNMDAALCHYAEEKLKEKGLTELDINQWLQLKAQVRSAKESLLSKEGEASIWIAGKGSQLILGSVQVNVQSQEIEKILMGGFFGEFSFQDALRLQRGSGIRSMGLPFESDPSITKQLACFLHASLKSGLPYPSYVLFNGGSMKPRLFQEAIVNSLKRWQPDFTTKGNTITLLSSSSLDLAVARGAAYFGVVKRGLGVRIGGGSPRAYYLQIQLKKSNGELYTQALTLLPRGVDEGTKIESENEFQLTPNTPVSFQLFSSHTRLNDKVGELIDIKEEEMAPLPPLKTILRFGKQKEKEEKIPVRLGIYLTEIGTLELWLQSLKTDHRWALEFQLRSERGAESNVSQLSQSFSDEVLESRYIEMGKEIIEQTFSLEHRIKAEEVMGALEKNLERARHVWSPTLLRKLFDTLIKQAEKMTVAPAYEARFWNLAGFLLRPGIGYPLDDYRLKELWKIILSDFKKEKNEEIELQKCICYRRVSAGLNKGQQTQLFNALYHTLPLKRGKLEVKKAFIYPYQEKIRTLASFELIDLQTKIKLGEFILKRILEGDGLAADFWSLGRIGARHLLYGSLANVIPRGICESWVRELAKAKGNDPRQMAFLLGLLARKTDQREINLSSELIDEVLEMMKLYPEVSELHEKLTTSHTLSIHEQEKIFGDSLPSGLLLEL